MSQIMMKCGCLSQSVCSRIGGRVFDPPIPSCVIHDCIDPMDSPPDLTGRRAKCGYFGRGGFRNYGPIYGGGKCSRQKCECLVPSSLDGLPFFSYQPDKEHDSFFCGCGGWD